MAAPRGRRRLPAVVLDDRPGVIAAVEHLVDLGHRRIAFVGGPDQFIHARNRREVWEATLDGFGLPADALCRGRLRRHQWRDRRLPGCCNLPARRRPTAIVFANDLMAIAGVAAATRLGRRVPRRLSVVGFDDIPVAAYMHPSLTTVAQDALAWGRAATRAVFDLVERRADADVELAPARLVVRESTASARRRGGGGGHVSPPSTRSRPTRRT